MAAVSVPIGWLYLGLVGVVAGIIASIVERFEFLPIDDNVLISLTTFVFLATVDIFYPL